MNGGSMLSEAVVNDCIGRITRSFEDLPNSELRGVSRGKSATGTCGCCTEVLNVRTRWWDLAE
jgi:hypothetical protein